MRLEIVNAENSDVRRVEELLKECSLPADGLHDQFNNFLVGKYEGRVVGAVGLEVYGRYGLLRSCCVSAEYRNEQVGSMLTRAVINQATDLQLSAVYLLTEGKDGFFSREGFKLTSREQIPPQVKQSALFAGATCCSNASAMVLNIAAPTFSTLDENAIRVAVRDKYAGRARQVATESGSSCCGSSSKKTFVTKDLYDSLPVDIPKEALLASLGCGNPTFLAQIKEGETVLDLGSGGGLDVLLSAKRTGPTGKVYGLDMTDDMLELARANQQRAGVTNVEFLKGHIESIPLPACCLDLIISNCVVNLSTNKEKVFSEAFRVLKPDGRLAISDIVFLKIPPAQMKKNIEAWAGCIAGALEISDYKAKLQQAGFVDVSIETTRVYELRDFEKYEGFNELPENEKKQLEGVMTASFIRAVKPVSPNLKKSMDDIQELEQSFTVKSETV